MLSVIDETESRRDLAERRESKFLVDDRDSDLVRRCLSQNARRTVYGEQVSVVRSIYFDDSSLSACHANLSGIGRRRKLRLRWYDSPTPGHACFLEVKWRENRVTGKHRLRIESTQRLGERSYREILEELRQCVPPRFSAALAQNFEPIIVVEYRREHFVSRDRRMRVTLDYDLTFYEQVGRSRISMVFPKKLMGLVVVEGKTMVGDESQLQALFHPLRLRLARCSKYVHGCRALGLIHESE